MPETKGVLTCCVLCCSAALECIDSIIYDAAVDYGSSSNGDSEDASSLDSLDAETEETADSPTGIEVLRKLLEANERLFRGKVQSQHVRAEYDAVSLAPRTNDDTGASFCMPLHQP